MRLYAFAACVSVGLVGALALDTSSGCKQAQSIIDLVNAECVVLAQQPEPAVIAIACEVFDVTSTIVQQFEVRVPADQAAAFIAAHPVKPGHPLPAGAK